MPQAADILGPPGDARAVLQVHASVVMEMLWVLMQDEGDQAADYPVRASRFDQAPGLEDRIAAFWGDGACFTELFLIAERGGVLFESDPTVVWRGLRDGAAGSGGHEALVSESPEDQVRFRERIRRLGAEPGLLDAWIQLLIDGWTAVSARWDETGRSIVERSVWELRARLGPNGTYRDLEGVVQHDFGGLLPRLFGDFARSGRPVAVLPAWHARKCFVLSLNDVLIVSAAAAPRSFGPSAETRDRARRFKAMGDPTRLAILEAAAFHARTVGELAELMGIAQPTASNHVRVLRDAGLLCQAKDGSRGLQANFDALQSLAAEAGRTFSVRPGAAGDRGSST